jgi:serpin B
MRIKAVIALSAVLILEVICPVFGANADSENYLSEFAFGVNASASEFYGIINGENKNENVFFSPYAVFAMCALLFEGASAATLVDYSNAFNFPQDAGKRRHIFERSLKIYANSKRGAVVRNSIWFSSKNKVLKSYKALAAAYCAGVYEDIKFGAPSAVSKINKWFKQNVSGNKELSVPGDFFMQNAGAVLLNVSLFEGKWSGFFDKKGSVEDDFFVSSKVKTTVKFLRQEGLYHYFENRRVQVLKMEFDKNASFGMIIILPKQNKISFAEQFLFKNSVSDIMSSLSVQNGVIYVPEVNSDSFFDLEGALYSAGIVSSDYAKISESQLTVSNFLHYSSICIDYEMKGAPPAVIEVGGDIGRIDRELPPFVFRADHPFIYAIIDKSDGKILFIGKMLNPSGGE